MAVGTFKTAKGKVYEITHLSYQEEKCPSTGKHHLQGYLEVSDHDGVKRSVLCNAYPGGRVHWEKRQGTGVQARDYAQKEDTRVPAGLTYCQGDLVDGGQGKRSDLKRLADSVLENMPLAQVARENPETWMKYYRGAIDLHNRVAPKPAEEERDVYILIGPAGTGKTAWCKERIAEWNLTCHEVQSNNSGALSFEKYNDEQAILIDDYEENALAAQALKQLTDRYACYLPGRGQSIMARHKVVFITSNFPISEWFPAKTSQINREAIERRAKAIMYCGLERWQLIGGKDHATTTPENRDVPNPMLKYVKPDALAVNSEFVMAPASSNRLGDVQVKDAQGNMRALKDVIDLSQDDEIFSQQF